MARGGDAGGLLLFGAIGCFAMVLVVILAILPMLRVQSMAIMWAQAILGFAALIGIGVGFLGFEKATGLGLAKAVGITLFVGAFLMVLPVIAYAARSRGLLQVALIGAPVIGLIAWSLAGIVAFGAKQHLGSGLATTIGVTLIASAIWDLVSLILLLSRAVRGRGAAEVIMIVGIIFLVARLVGLVSYGTSFIKLRGKTA
jgi:hypothetical protein